MTLNGTQLREYSGKANESNYTSPQRTIYPGVDGVGCSVVNHDASDIRYTSEAIYPSTVQCSGKHCACMTAQWVLVVH